MNTEIAVALIASGGGVLGGFCRCDCIGEAHDIPDGAA